MSRYGNPLLPWPQKRSLVWKSIPSAVAESVGTPRQCPAFLGQAVLTCWGAWRRLRAGREMESDFIAFFCIPRWCFPIAHFFFDWHGLKPLNRKFMKMTGWHPRLWWEHSILFTPFYTEIHGLNILERKIVMVWIQQHTSSDRSVVWKQIFYQWLGLKARNSFCVPANTVVSCRLPLKQFCEIIWKHP